MDDKTEDERPLYSYSPLPYLDRLYLAGFGSVWKFGYLEGVLLVLGAFYLRFSETQRLSQFPVSFEKFNRPRFSFNSTFNSSAMSLCL